MVAYVVGGSTEHRAALEEAMMAGLIAGRIEMAREFARFMLDDTDEIEGMPHELTVALREATRG